VVQRSRGRLLAIWGLRALSHCVGCSNHIQSTNDSNLPWLKNGGQVTSPSGRSWILRKGLALQDSPSLEGILLDLVDDGAAGLASRGRNVLRPVAGDLEGGR
jgi:hypothetical protein